MKFARWLAFVPVALCAGVIARCSSDTSSATDAGNDVTTSDSGTSDVSKSDATADASSDAPSDAIVDATADVIEAGPAHAYVANYNNGVDGGIVVFAMPLTDASTPVLTLGGSNGLAGPQGLRVDPAGDKLWVAESSKNQVLAYALPLSANSAPTVTLTPQQEPVDLAFDSSKNLWVTEFSGICEKWNSPPNGAAALHVHDSVGGNLFAIAIDSSDNIYTGAPGSPNLSYFGAPQAADAGPTFTNSNFANSISGLAVVSGKLYAASYQSGTLVSFALPLSGASTTSAVAGGGPYGWRLSLSPSGDLIVPGFGGAANLVEFLAAPGFTTPSLVISSGLHDARAVAFGP